MGKEEKLSVANSLICLRFKGERKVSTVIKALEEIRRSHVRTV